MNLKKILTSLFVFGTISSLIYAVTINGKDYDTIWNPFGGHLQYTTSVSTNAITAGTNNVSIATTTGGVSISVNGSGGAAGSLDVQKDGSNVDTSVSTLNFTGAPFSVTSSPAGKANVSLVASSVTLGGTLIGGTGISIGYGTNVTTITATGSGMTSGATYYIQNSNTLQSGATFYVSSGTVQGNFYSSTITASNLITGAELTINGDINRPVLIKGVLGGGLYLGEYAATLGGFWSSNISPTVNNYALISNGAITAMNATNNFQLNINDVTKAGLTSAGELSVGAGSTGLGLGNMLGVKPINSTFIGEVIQGATSQSADLQEWQNSAGTVRGLVNSDASALGIGEASISNPAAWQGFIQATGPNYSALSVRGNSHQYDIDTQGNHLEIYDATVPAYRFTLDEFGNIGFPTIDFNRKAVFQGNSTQVGGIFGLEYYGNNITTGSLMGRVDFGADQDGFYQYPARILGITDTSWATVAGSNVNVSGHLEFQTLPPPNTLTTSNSASPTTKLTIRGNGNIFINGFSTSTVGLIIQSTGSTQSADLQEWQISNGVVVDTISATGIVSVTTTNVTGSFNNFTSNNDTTDPPLAIKTLFTPENSGNFYHSAFLYGKIPNDANNGGEFIITVTTSDLPVDPGVDPSRIKRPEISLQYGDNPGPGAAVISLRSSGGQFPNNNPTDGELIVSSGTVSLYGDTYINHYSPGPNGRLLLDGIASTLLAANSSGVVISTTGAGITGIQFPAVFTGSLFVGLTSGATFQAFVPTKAITLKNIVYTADVASVAGSGDTFTCGDTSGNKVSVVSANAAAAGTTTSATGTGNISAGTTVYMRMDSAAATKPQGNVACGYVMQ